MYQQRLAAGRFSAWKYVWLICLILAALPRAGWAATQAQLAAGARHSLYLDGQGVLWAWGANDAGQLGDGSTIARPVPVRVGDGYAQVSAGEQHSLAVKSDGSLWAWGANQFGVLGDGGRQNRLVPTLVGQGFRLVATRYGHVLAIKQDGTLWAWGDNTDGQLGDGTTTIRSKPVYIGSGFVAASAGFNHSLALKEDGSLWAWGENEFGQLGDGSTTSRTTPVKVAGQFSAIVARRMYSYARKDDGSLWQWGVNGLGKLLVAPSQTCREVSPCAQVPTRFAGGVNAFGAGELHALAIGADGIMTGWGANSRGELGNGSGKTLYRVSRMPVDFVAIDGGRAHTLALDVNGSVWAWGDNRDGQLGLGADAGPQVLAPVQVAGLAAPPAFTSTAQVPKKYANGAAMLKDDPAQLQRADTQMILSRGACYGSCPAYTLTVRGDGELTFQRAGDSAIKGRLRARQVGALLLAFRRMGFFSLHDDYTGNGPNCPTRMTDSPGARVTLRLGRFAKSVGHYHGCAGLAVLQRLTAFEDEIDQIAGTTEWLDLTDPQKNIEILLSPLPPPRAHMLSPN